MSQSREARILDAAGELLLTFGYRKVTIALPVDHDTSAHTGGLRHYPRGMIGTRNLPVHPTPA